MLYSSLSGREAERVTVSPKLISRQSDWPFFLTILYSAFCISLMSLFVSLPAEANDMFIHSTNWGSTGLMEVPDARVMKEDSVRFGFTQSEPYRYYYGTISPFNRFEFNFRITEVIDVPAFEQNNTRDKAFDVKYLLMTEGKYLPAFSVGFMDPHGTRVYPSQYLALSKQVYPFDFTLGLGNGRFGKKQLPEQGEGLKLEMLSDTAEWLKDSQLFGGVQYAVTDSFTLMAEYSPVKYHIHTRDPAQSVYFQAPAASKINIGFRYKPVDWAEIDVTYQRGGDIGFNISTGFDIGNELLPIYSKPYSEPWLMSKRSLSERLTTALTHSGFSDILVDVNGDVLVVSAQNERYYYDAKAVGVILDQIGMIKPSGISNIGVTLHENGIAYYELTVDMADIEDLYSDRLTAEEFLYLSRIDTDKVIKPYARSRYRKSFRYGIKPSFETFVNDRSGFFKYRLGLAGWVSQSPWKGAKLVAGLEGYPLNNISSESAPLSIPVRSDITLYKKEKLSLGRLLYDQIYKTGGGLYGKVSAGYLEVQYAGLDAEVARSLLDGRFFVGAGGSIVKKREPDKPFDLVDGGVKDFYTTAFINTRLNVPEYNMALDLKAGRFLAGDEGVRFTLSKHIKGVILRAWYTVTDTSDFSDQFNDGYRDKGLSVSIPVRVFSGAESRKYYNYSLAPWTRDTGQDIDHFGTLFDFIGRNTRLFINKDRDMIYR